MTDFRPASARASHEPRHGRTRRAGTSLGSQDADEALAGLRGMFAMTKEVEVVKRWVEGPDVLTWFELRIATAGPLAIVNWSHVEAGRITRIRVTFDPRPLIP